MRVLGLCDTDKGTIFVAKTEVYTTIVKPNDKTVVVTDSPDHIKNWQLAYDERRDMLDVVKSFHSLKNAGKLKVKDQMLDPSGILEMRKIDERGSVWEFNSDQTNNGHVATLLLIWAGVKAIRGRLVADQFETVTEDSEDDDNSTMPFSI
jgi:hypothetical protein